MDRKGKTLGILGGMGPEAGASLFHRLVKMTPATRDSEHIKTLFFSNPDIPDRTEGILGHGPDPLDELVRSAHLLQRSGADTIILACLTSHFYLPVLRRKVNCEFISAIDETVAELKRCCPDAVRIGVLGTTGTIKTGLFQAAVAEAGREAVILSGDDQQNLFTEAVYGAHGIKAGQIEPGRQLLLQAADVLVRSGAECIILGCTEIPLAIGQNDSPVPLIDPIEALLKKSILECLGRSALAEISLIDKQPVE